MNVLTFKAEHLADMALQEAQAYLSTWVKPEMAEALEEHPSYSGEVDGRIVVCSGIVPIWMGRAMAWAYLAPDAGQHFLAIHREVKRFLDNCYLQRIEATVDIDFEQGHRWMKLLGFKLEAPCMRAYRPDGGNCSLYARIRP